ncbi:hypothetical protein BDV3_005736 [Batrachochytrium dendrobatidis]|uniref:Kinetochore protein SPC25 n=1 Tax=Batrachochytrium dendrobatidis (strain JEL423) TaxID=403673 RepID=A0A177WIU4_BATDL|nr:kinetochore-associated Ndc80 complex subunit spc25 [Batrachochytrium dendrobatidis]KAK5666922.1 kinetochore-associated Ndc80 complex subunit spc25 [Batrachochytrium dendrobatidis]OAJ40048.1 hypothetical protein BDEG_23827 [Batrachochytrium dendrobatidis JEL423]
MTNRLSTIHFLSQTNGFGIGPSGSIPPRTPRLMRASLMPAGTTPVRLHQPYTSESVQSNTAMDSTTKEPETLDLKSVCSTITQTFDSWVLAKGKSMADSRNTFLKDMKDLQVRSQELRKLVETLKSDEEDLMQTLDTQRNEQELMEGEISQLAQTRKAKEAELETLHTKIKQLTSDIHAKRQELNLKKNAQQAEAEDLIPMLDMYEKLLAMKMVQTVSDVIQFKFTHVNDAKLEQEYSFELGVSDTTAYKLISCKPMLLNIDASIEWLNSSRDLYTFVKYMRSEFTKYARSQSRHMR